MVPPDDEPEPSSALRIDADLLEYTRQGLQTRQDIPLEVGQHNRVVIVRPRRVVAVGDAHGGFAVGESFPLCAALRVVWLYGEERSVFAHSRGESEAPLGVFQVYGHADASGDEHDDKLLSERRAEVGRALLLGDVDAFAAVAEHEGWSDAHAQVMLRVLGCDPGPIDGDLGPLTCAGVELFQSRYVEGDFHRHERAPAPRNPQLKVDGKLGAQTHAALLEALVVASSAHLGQDALHPTHPASGCSHYNLASSSDASASRRLSLVVHPQVPEHSENAPCTAGNEQACATVDDARHRCLWFREHVAERPAGPPRFHDPRWLALGSGNYLLSALTTVADDEEVEFRVYPDAQAWPSNALGEPLCAKPTLGVVHVEWQAPGDWDPSAGPQPVFDVLHAGSGARALAPWPQTDTVRLLFAALDAEGPFPSQRPESYRLRATSGLYDEHRPVTAVVRSSLHHFALELPNAPIDARFDLRCDFHGTGLFDATLLEDVPFAALRSACSEGTRCFEEPPPAEPTLAQIDPDDPDAYVPIHADDIEPDLDEDG